LEALITILYAEMYQNAIDHTQTQTFLSLET